MARRGENIRKRSDGRWEGRYIKGRSADGKPCWGYVYGATYTEVREISARKKAEYGIYNLNSTDITFSEISEQWLYSVRQGVKESTFAHYQYTLRHYLQPVFGDFKVSALSEKILEQGLLAVITPANGKQKPLGATMAQECLSMLRRICKYAAHFHLIRPLEIMVKLPQKSPKVLLPFTTEEQKKLYALLSSYRGMQETAVNEQNRLQQEMAALRNVSGRLAIYAVDLGLSNSTSDISIKSNLIEMQTELFQDNPNDAHLLELATKTFTSLRDSEALSETSTDSNGSLSYSALLTQMNALVLNLNDYSDVKSIEKELNTFITELREADSMPDTMQDIRGASVTINPTATDI